MKILVATTLYPNASMPNHGVFVENRLKAYLRKYDADVRVIAPAPWFPSRSERFGRYSAWARAPRHEFRAGLAIDHPRYLLPPKIGMNYVPHSLEKCFFRAASDLIEGGWNFDLIDAHYFFPDGVALANVAKRLGKPVVITARGTDVNRIPDFPKPRRRIIDAAHMADAVITVADALRDALIDLGAPAAKITTLRNGVDLKRFAPQDRQTARKNLGVDGPVIVSVGHLVERKGHHHVIEALRDIDGATLLIAGDGEERKALEALAKTLNVADRVRFLGAVPHSEIASVYAAADLLVLASAREGWANVLLEAMACGTPVVATDVWGAREVVKTPAAGRLAQAGDVASIVGAVKEILNCPPDRDATRAYAEGFSWDETVDGMNEIFRALTDKHEQAA